MTDASDRLRDKKTLWAAANRGIQTRIAEELGYSSEYVNHVLFGRRRSPEIEQKLAENGAPGFKADPQKSASKRRS